MSRPGKSAAVARLGTTRSLYEQWQARHHARPAVLYHYTAAAGLLSMIKSGHVWASESRYMNDPREFLHGADVIERVIDRFVIRKNPPQALLEIRDNVRRHIEEKLQNVRIFSTSFCTDGDLLSQWRGYGDTGGGYTLGFEPRLLFGGTQLERPPMRALLRVIYNPKQQESLVAMWARAAAAGCVSGNDPRFWRFFSEALASFKDPAYAEEGEWRLVQFGRAWDARGNTLFYPVLFRERRGEVLPYADIDLSRSKAYPGRLPIAEIVYGPTLDPERSSKALRLLIEGAGYGEDEVKLRRSIVPFNKA